VTHERLLALIDTLHAGQTTPDEEAS
jgi:hypothetical protein